MREGVLSHGCLPLRCVAHDHRVTALAVAVHTRTVSLGGATLLRVIDGVAETFNAATRRLVQQPPRFCAQSPHRPKYTVMRARALLAIVTVSSVMACTDAEKERLKRTTVPTYDPATGKLTQLTYDANRNGRVDTWTSMEGTRPLRLPHRPQRGRQDRPVGVLRRLRRSRESRLLPEGRRRARRVGVRRSPTARCSGSNSRPRERDQDRSTGILRSDNAWMPQGRSRSFVLKSTPTTTAGAIGGKRTKTAAIRIAEYDETATASPIGGSPTKARSSS